MVVFKNIQVRSAPVYSGCSDNLSSTCSSDSLFRASFRLDHTPVLPWQTPRAKDSSCQTRRSPYPHGALLRAQRRQIGWVSNQFLIRTVLIQEYNGKLPSHFMRRARHVQQPVRALEIAVILRFTPHERIFPPIYWLELYAGQADKYS